MILDMNAHIFANSPDSRVAVMLVNAVKNCTADTQYTNLMFETDFFGKDSYVLGMENPLIAICDALYEAGVSGGDLTAFAEEYGLFDSDDNATFLQAAVDKMTGVAGGYGGYDGEDQYGSYVTLPAKNVIPRSDTSRTPVIVLLSDFMMEDNHPPLFGVNDSGTNYWSVCMRNQAQRFADAYPNGILLPVWFRGDFTGKNLESIPGLATAWDGWMADNVAPYNYASRGWNYTKITAPATYPAALAAFKINFDAGAAKP